MTAHTWSTRRPKRTVHDTDARCHQNGIRFTFARRVGGLSTDLGHLHLPKFTAPRLTAVPTRSVSTKPSASLRHSTGRYRFGSRDPALHSEMDDRSPAWDNPEADEWAECWPCPDDDPEANPTTLCLAQRRVPTLSERVISLFPRLLLFVILLARVFHVLHPRRPARSSLASGTPATHSSTFLSTARSAAHCQKFGPELERQQHWDSMRLAPSYFWDGPLSYQRRCQIGADDANLDSSAPVGSWLPLRPHFLALSFAIGRIPFTGDSFRVVFNAQHPTGAKFF